MTSPIPLRERLADARYDEDLILVDDALAVFRDWLREAAEGLHAVENEADIAGLFADQRNVLTGLADAINWEINNGR